jgi:hypothetical protein
MQSFFSGCLEIDYLRRLAVFTFKGGFAVPKLGSVLLLSQRDLQSRLACYAQTSVGVEKVTEISS